MQIVIEISNTLKRIVDDDDSKAFFHFMWQAYLMDAIKNGVPLPEGHGRLIDGDKLLAQAQVDGAYDYVSAREIANAPTILEADKEGD